MSMPSLTLGNRSCRVKGQSLTNYVLLILVRSSSWTAGERRVVTVQDASIVIDDGEKVVHGTLLGPVRRQVRRQIQTPVGKQQDK